MTISVISYIVARGLPVIRDWSTHLPPHANPRNSTFAPASHSRRVVDPRCFTRYTGAARLARSFGDRSSDSHQSVDV